MLSSVFSAIFKNYRPGGTTWKLWYRIFIHALDEIIKWMEMIKRAKKVKTDEKFGEISLAKQQDVS